MHEFIQSYTNICLYFQTFWLFTESAVLPLISDIYLNLALEFNPQYKHAAHTLLV